MGVATTYGIRHWALLLPTQAMARNAGSHLHSLLATESLFLDIPLVTAFNNNGTMQDLRFLPTDGSLIPVPAGREIFLFGSHNLLKSTDIWAARVGEEKTKVKQCYSYRFLFLSIDTSLKAKLCKAYFDSTPWDFTCPYRLQETDKYVNRDSQG